MKKNTLTISVALVLLLGSCGPSTRTPDFAKLEQEIREIFTQTISLFKNKDVDGLVNRFTPDGTLKITGNALVAGHDALRENYSGVVQLQDFTINFEIFKVEIAEAADLAYAVANVNVSFITPEGPFSDFGKSLLVFKRINNEWKIAAENISSEPPPMSSE